MSRLEGLAAVVPAAAGGQRLAEGRVTAVPDNRWHGTLDAAIAEVPADWAPLLRAWRREADGQSVAALIERRLAEGAVVYPSQPFRALVLTRLDAVRVVIVGQDPYHGAGQAEGLAFSVPPGLRKPPSLRNIDAEIQRDLGLPMPSDGHLGHWASQGVLLMNTSFSVEDGRAGAHARAGWASLSEGLLRTVARSAEPVVFMLWGQHAQSLAAMVQAVGQGRHCVLMANHPSPLSARRPPVPFIGCGHFSAANAFLAHAGRGLVDWRR